MRRRTGIAALLASVVALSTGCGGSGSGPFEHIYLLAPGIGGIIRLNDINGSGFVTSDFVAAAGGPLGTGCVAIYVDRSGRILLADWKNDRVIKVDNMAGGGWEAFGSRGEGVGNFKGPTGVCADSRGRIYVTDWVNTRVTRIDDMSGAGWTTLGARGGGPGRFIRPLAIALDSSDRIYVLDWVGGFGVTYTRLIRFDDMSGTGWTEFHLPDRAYDLQVDSSGKVYVGSDDDLALGDRIVRFDDVSGSGAVTISDMSNPVAIDSAGRIYGANRNSVVRVNDTTGAGRVTYELPGVPPGVSGHVMDMYIR